jgi:hypothetical protein
MATPNSPDKPAAESKDLTDRVKRLEDEVFKGGPPGFGERLRKIDEDLAALQQSSGRKFQDLEEKLQKAIRITAELRELVSQMGGAGKTQTL